MPQQIITAHLPLPWLHPLHHRHYAFPPCGRRAHFFILTYSLEWIIEMEAENRSGLVSRSVMTVKAETLTVQFGTKRPQRTQKSFMGEILNSLFFDTSHFQKKCTINFSYFSKRAIPLFPLRLHYHIDGVSKCRVWGETLPVMSWNQKHDLWGSVAIFFVFAEGNVWGHVLGKYKTKCTWW